jgi:subtilisin-like proprotein convertase family protein
MPSGSLAPGADDNASGTCTVIEAARLLAPYTFDYSIVFIAFDEEEMGLIGSRAYADTAYFRGDTILGVINLDMIAFDSNNDNKLDIHTNTNSITLADDLYATYITYLPMLVPSKIFSISGGSDHQSFWTRGYKATLTIESTSDFNTYYHTVNDNFSHVNMPYFLRINKAAIAALMSFAWDYRMTFTHTPIQSSNDTNARIATVVIKSSHPLAKLSNAPRLYYNVDAAAFTSIGAYYSNLDTFKFLIPGKPLGSMVSYYLAAQDTLGRYVGTLPAGGKGLNPPGSIKPPSVFTYHVVNVASLNQCSQTLPKPILDLQNTYDTIVISPEGNVLDININLTLYHTYDSDVDIYLKGPQGTEIDLSSDNGSSGNNYVNTTFDDEAANSITSGSPPFTGSFRPEQPLSTFDNNPIAGNWVLRVYDDSNTDTGSLINWCLIAQHSIPIGVGKNEQPLVYSLSQNYPNPFNAGTKIDFSLPRSSEVKIVLYDMLGRETMVLVNSSLTGGKYGVYLNANNLASGIYFYSMYLDGNLFATKKMTLIK